MSETIGPPPDRTSVRERVRAEIERIHAQYDMPRPREAFIEAFERCRLEDLLEAERRLRKKPCCRLSCRYDRHFAALVRSVTTDNARRRNALQEDRRILAEMRRIQQQRTWVPPGEHIQNALTLLSHFWLPDRQAFLFHPDPPPFHETLRRALARLARASPDLRQHVVEAAWRTWCRNHPNHGPRRRADLRSLLDRAVAEILGSSPAAHR